MLCIFFNALSRPDESDATSELQGILSKPVPAGSTLAARLTPMMRATPNLLPKENRGPGPLQGGRPSGLATPVPLKPGLVRPNATPGLPPGAPGFLAPAPVAPAPAPAVPSVHMTGLLSPGANVVTPTAARRPSHAVPPTNPPSLGIAINIGGPIGSPISVGGHVNTTLDDSSSDDEYREANESKDYPVFEEEKKPRGRLASIRLPKLGSSMTDIHGALGDYRMRSKSLASNVPKLTTPVTDPQQSDSPEALKSPLPMIGDDGNVELVPGIDIPERPHNPGASMMMRGSGDYDDEDDEEFDEATLPQRVANPGLRISREVERNGSPFSTKASSSLSFSFPMLTFLSLWL